MKKQRQSIPPVQRYSYDDFLAQFPNDDACLEYIKEARWPDGVTVCDSKTCEGQERKHHRVAGRTAYVCGYCGHQIYPLAGTIFEKTTTPLHKWFLAIFLMSATRCGISAKQLQRSVTVTYKTAWRMFKQIRSLFAEELTLEGSSVELDECYVGGREKNKHRNKRSSRGRETESKTPVFGMIERGGRVVAQVTPNVKTATIFPIIEKRVMPKSTIFTDEYPIYDSLAHHKNEYEHKRVNHSQDVYVMGDAHTNSLEGFWSLVKRGIGGVYHSVSRKHLQDYLNEYSFRFNHRFDNQPMFASVLQQVALKAEMPSLESDETKASEPKGSGDRGQVVPF